MQSPLLLLDIFKCVSTVIWLAIRWLDQYKFFQYVLYSRIIPLYSCKSVMDQGLTLKKIIKNVCGFPNPKHAYCGCLMRLNDKSTYVVCSCYCFGHTWCNFSDFWSITMMLLDDIWWKTMCAIIYKYFCSKE